MNEGLAVVKVHSHPGGYDQFSATDDRSDQELFSSVFGWLDVNDAMASLIMLPDGTLFGREVTPHGIGRDLLEVRVAGDDFQFFRPTANGPEEAIPEHAHRIAQTFGRGTYQKMRSLRIGVIGCSGTGSIVIEQLARNCIGELVVVDPEPVELGNLNRILNSTRQDADKSVAKVAVVQRSVKAMGLGTRVAVHQADLMDLSVLRNLASCDVLFGCMDSVDGRHILNKLSSFYLIPYIDLGVRIDADGKGGVDSVCGAVHTLQPGGSSLMSRGVYDQAALNAAMLKRCNPIQYAERRREGYIKGIREDQPAVISLNMQIAATAVNELLARLHPFRVEPNKNYAIRRTVLSDPAASCDSVDGNPCIAFQRWVGLGDQTPFLGFPELEPADEVANA